MHDEEPRGVMQVFEIPRVSTTIRNDIDKGENACVSVHYVENDGAS